METKRTPSLDDELTDILQMFAEAVRLLTLYPNADGEVEDPLASILKAIDARLPQKKAVERTTKTFGTQTITITDNTVYNEALDDVRTALFGETK